VFSSGSLLLIENVGEELDACEPLLLKQTFRDAGVERIKLVTLLWTGANFQAVHHYHLRNPLPPEASVGFFEP
jgi:hypothetical protein